MSNTETIEFNPSWHIWSEQKREVHARAEHLRVLFRHSIFLFLGNFAGSITLVVGLWSTVEQNLLLAWLLVMFILNTVRWIVARRFPTGSISEAETQQWEKRFIASVAVSGIVWGTAGSLFFVSGHIEHNLFLTLLNQSARDINLDLSS